MCSCKAAECRLGERVLAMGDWVLAMGDRRLDIGYGLWAKRVLEYYSR